MDVAALLLGAFLGAASSLGTEWFRRRWARADARENRGRQRTEEAGKTLLGLYAEVDARLGTCHQYGSSPSQQEMKAWTRPMRDLAVSVGDREVRRRIEALALVLEQMHALEVMGNGPPFRIGTAVQRSGRNTVAHLLSGETLDDFTHVEAYLADIEEEWSLLEEVEKDRRGTRSEGE